MLLTVGTEQVGLPWGDSLFFHDCEGNPPPNKHSAVHESEVLHIFFFRLHVFGG